MISKMLVSVTMLLIFAGGMVTSTGSGLSVPDWPTTFGYQMFSFPLSDMVGGIFYEHGHRMIATTVGFITLIFSILIWIREERIWVRRLALFAFLTICIQGLLVD